jgi:hypothetical protein
MCAANNPSPGDCIDKVRRPSFTSAFLLYKRPRRPPPDGSLKRKGAKPKGGGERGGKGGEQEEEGGDRPVQASYGLRVGGTSHTKCNVSTDSAPWDHPSV